MQLMTHIAISLSALSDGGGMETFTIGRKK